LIITESFGFVAGALATCSVIPQVVRVLRLRSAREISLVFTILLMLGLIFWMVYGIRLELTPVIVWNSIGIIVTGLLLYAKLKYGR
jgi:MtN3 and saliva related transmembrane protein